MTLNELITAVYNLTARADLVDQTKQTVLASTLTMHMSSFYYKDILSGQIDFATQDYHQQIDTSAVPRFRSISYMRLNKNDITMQQVDPFTGLPPRYYVQPFFKIISPDDIIDNIWDAEKCQVAYQAGGTIHLKAINKITSVLMGWYAYPDLTDMNFTSWIAAEVPYAIVYHATAAILNTIGQEQAASKYDRPENAQGQGGGLVQEQIRMLRASNIVAQGY